MARYSVNGARIRETRLSKGIRSKDLAREAGISEGTLLAIEEGKRQATEGTLLSIAKALGIRADELLAVGPAVPHRAPAEEEANEADAKEEA